MPKLQKEIKPIRTEDLGIILAEVKTTAQHFLVQLLDKDFNVIKQADDNKKIRWEDITRATTAYAWLSTPMATKSGMQATTSKKKEPEAVFFYLNPKSNPPNTTPSKPTGR